MLRYQGGLNSLPVSGDGAYAPGALPEDRSSADCGPVLPPYLVPMLPDLLAPVVLRTAEAGR